MSFYLHQEKLADHIANVQAQIQQIRTLKSMILRLEVGPEQHSLVSNSIRNLEKLDTGLCSLVRVLEDHSDDMSLFFHQLDQRLDVITNQIDTLFD